ncbi:HPr kinase/phosphorylase [Phreatobacter sp.]|uniref:HPr kinase/phosphorylase n=1 Tax=Phreatobacter sp. TaxID=1966341 RepID=UPI003F724DF1
MTGPGTIHGSVVLVGSRAVLIRGPSGSGKSRLALRLIDGPPIPGAPPVRLVADDRVLLAEVHGRLVARPPAALAGLIELRGIGIVARPFETAGIVRLVIDLSAPDATRMPEPESRSVAVGSVILPRLAVEEGADPLPGLVDWLIGASRDVANPASRR